MVRLTRLPALVALWALWMLASLPTEAAEVIYSRADGTLADGGLLGSYDGVVDSWNWVFSPTGFAGAVTLTTETPASAVEHRIVCEYDLRGMVVPTPFKATLTFTTRSVNVFPFPDVTLHVYSYPADLIESPGDYSREPATLQGVFMVTADQASRVETLDVTGLVASALLAGDNLVAFRFQIDPNTPHVTNQVFIDALDTDPVTKPFLIIRSALPGDADDDGNVDLDDFAIFTDCLAGPKISPEPTRAGVSARDCLWYFDRDADEDVDLEDFSSFLGSFAQE